MSAEEREQEIIDAVERLEVDNPSGSMPSDIIRDINKHDEAYMARARARDATIGRFMRFINIPWAKPPTSARSGRYMGRIIKLDRTGVLTSVEGASENDKNGLSNQLYKVNKEKKHKQF